MADGKWQMERMARDAVGIQYCVGCSSKDGIYWKLSSFVFEEVGINQGVNQLSVSPSFLHQRILIFYRL